MGIYAVWEVFQQCLEMKEESEYAFDVYKCSFNSYHIHKFILLESWSLVKEELILPEESYRRNI